MRTCAARALTICWLVRSVASFAVQGPGFRPSAFARLRMSSPSSAGHGEKTHFYSVGTRGVAWGDEERAAWRQLVEQEPKRSYREEVLDKVDALRETAADSFETSKYGSLSCNRERYPLVVIKSRMWDAAQPTVLVTGGVHGYETSGVQGALMFLQTSASEYLSRVNLVVAPCVSPWGYEHIQVFGSCVYA